jgi:hypothetical protein
VGLGGLMLEGKWRSGPETIGVDAGVSERAVRGPG